MQQTLKRWLDSDISHSLPARPPRWWRAAIALVCVFCSLLQAGWRRPTRLTWPRWSSKTPACRPLGWKAAPQVPAGHRRPGRDILSALIYGARISLVVGLASVLLSVLVGVALGLLAGFKGGWIDAAAHAPVRCDAVFSGHFGGAAGSRAWGGRCFRSATKPWPLAC
jgi:peptide/nickel transport system permease protein